ncbi:MAG: NAD(P)/FAD-dependent oxidoreductase [Syntrophomonadaceae bacterium]|jgi:thioredoxin reductase (NADPH)|nr:NAD(P)/FAD-dependent oxidoreductase [Syntrophomonadaceae bacterium]
MNMSAIIKDIVILGCGPAGLSAAINAKIRNRDLLVLGTENCSPPLHKAQRIDNYLGFHGVKGGELLDHFLEHSQAMAVKIHHSKVELVHINEDGTFNLLTGGEILSSKAIILATGIPYKATLPQEDSYLGKGLGYCATCDGPLYRDRVVIIISHNQEGEAEANYMAQICRQVYYLPLYRGLGQLDGRIKLVKDAPARIIGNGQVQGLELKGGESIEAEGLFVLGGETAPDRLIPGLEIVENHIQVDRQQRTSIPGVYAAGDCTGKPYQVAKAIGEGQVAGLNASNYVAARA